MLRGKCSTHRKLIFSTHSGDGWFNIYPIRAVRTDRWKYIRAPREELYDLAKDPGELQNLAKKRSEVVQALSAALDEVLTQETGSEAAQVRMDRETIEKLRSLGYVAAGEMPAPSGELRDPKEMIAKEAFERSKLTFAGGICSGVRLRELPEPVFIESGQGSRFKDIDGNEYIDYVLSYGPLILGHRPRVVVDAVIQQLAKGTMFAGCCELDFLVSEEMVRMVPGLDLVHFTNSGTESLHFVLRLARAYTGRDKVIKFEGHYHGWTDELNISVKPSPPMGARNAPWKMREAAGVPENVGDNLVILPWNDLGIVGRTLKERDHEIAAIIMEPIMTNSGGILPKEEYIHGVRELTTKHGVVLIFDEVVTGFRVALGGAQKYLGVVSDLCVFAKGFAAGTP